MSERKDKIKNKAEVAKSLLKDPTQSQREVAKDTWLSLWNVNDKMKELEQTWTESQIMDRILQMDDEIIALANDIHLKTIKEKLQKWKELTLHENKLIWDLANNSTKRKAIFGKKWDDWSDKNIILQV